ncbi:MAG: class I SAM-dependent methyltransferase [Myxococcales bacterium]
MSVALVTLGLPLAAERPAPDLRIADRIVTRHGKHLDVRQHKKDWLSLDFLRNLQRDTREFCEHVLQHEHRVAVTACYICGSTQRKTFGETYGIGYQECASCSHVYAQVRLTPEDLFDYYRKKYFVGTADIDPKLADARAHMVVAPKLRFVSDFVQTEQRRWLDVGAGNGGVVACAREMGFDAVGLEPGREARQFARKVFGFEMHDHSVQQELALRGPGSYDLVSFFMVLEHVTDPASQVAAAAELLAPGGLLVIEVPTADSVSAMADIAFPNQGLRQTVGVHIMNYTRGSLRHLVDSSGLDTEAMWFLGQDIFNLVIHMALANPAFLDSALCRFFLDSNDALQRIVDDKELSDEVILVARKPFA